MKNKLMKFEKQRLEECQNAMVTGGKSRPNRGGYGDFTKNGFSWDDLNDFNSNSIIEKSKKRKKR